MNRPPGCPRILSPTFLLLAWLLLAAAPAPAASTVEEVVVVFKTHFDIGYTDFASNVVQRYRTSMIDQALEVVDRSRGLPPEQQFAWTLPGWPLTQIAADWPGQTADRQRRVLEAFRQGRFVVHALPFTTHTELLEPEDLVRGLGFSTRLARAVALPLPRDAKMTDVPCHSWILPTLLRRAGVEFLHLGCNAASRSPRVPALFWWQGPDGSRLLTMYTAESYGTGLVPPPDWPHRTWLALIHTGDNHGPPTPQEVQQLRAEASSKLPHVRVRIGRLSDFADALLAEKPDLPVVRGDMSDTWIHGPMCDPAGARLARHTRPALESTEVLHTLLSLWGVPLADATSTLAAAREQSLLYGEHTWGGAFSWVADYSSGKGLPHGQLWRDARAQGRFTRLEASWAEHSAYIERASVLLAPLTASLHRTLAESVAVAGPRVVVFNPLPWVRSERVDVPNLDARYRGATPADGRARDAVAVTAHAGSLGFPARDVPSLGYRTYVLAESPPPATVPPRPGPTTLENRWFRIAFDPARAAVRSWIDKASGREWVAEDDPHGFGQFLLERFSADDVGAYVRAYVKITADWATNELGKPNLPSTSLAPYRQLTPRDATLRFEQDAGGSAAVLESAAREELPAITTRWWLPADEPYLELEVTVHAKAADPWPEACWIALPFQMREPEFRLGRPGSIVDPTRDLVAGANRHLFALQTGVALFERSGEGIALCPIDSPLVSLDAPGCWRYEPDFVPRRPRVYVNLFNNQWTTNFRLWNEGTWTSRIRLWCFRRFAPEAALVTLSLAARYPLTAGSTDGPAGQLPPHAAGLSADRRGFLVTAFGADPAGGAGSGSGDLMLRLWELAGRGGRTRIELPGLAGVAAAQPTDLRGEPVGPAVRVRSGTFTVDLPAYAPLTVRVSATPVASGQGPPRPSP